MELIKHECGVAMIRLLKPLSYYKEKYGTELYGLDRLYLIMEKEHNRGQEGCWFRMCKTKRGSRQGIYIQRTCTRLGSYF